MDNNEYIDFFNKNVCPYVKDFEKIRMNYLSAFVLIYVFAVVIFIYMLVKLDIVHYYKDVNIWFWLVTGGYFLVVFSHPVACMMITRYRSVIKEKFLNHMINKLYGLKYYNSNPTVWTNIMASFGMNNLVDKHIDIDELADLSVFSGCTFSFDDYIKGKYKDSNIEIQEISLKKIFGEGSVPFFHGLILSVDFKKDFNGRVIFYSDKELCLRSASAGLEQIYTEDVEFNKLFNVYSSDQIDARYIFNPVFMEKLKYVSKNYSDYKINGEFKNQKLYIIISSAKNWFEIPFFKPANTPLVFYQPVNDLKNLLSIVDSVLS